MQKISQGYPPRSLSWLPKDVIFDGKPFTARHVVFQKSEFDPLGKKLPILYVNINHTVND